MIGSDERTTAEVHSARVRPRARGPGGRRPSRPSGGAAPGRRRRARRARPPTAKAASPTASTLVPSSTFSVWSERSLMNTSSRLEVRRRRARRPAPRSCPGSVGDLEGGPEPAHLAPVLLVEGRRAVEAAELRVGEVVGGHADARRSRAGSRGPLGHRSRPRRPNCSGAEGPDRDRVADLDTEVLAG